MEAPPPAVPDPPLASPPAKDVVEPTVFFPPGLLAVSQGQDKETLQLLRRILAQNTECLRIHKEYVALHLPPGKEDGTRRYCMSVTKFFIDYPKQARLVVGLGQQETEPEPDAGAVALKHNLILPRRYVDLVPRLQALLCETRETYAYQRLEPFYAYAYEMREALGLVYGRVFEAQRNYEGLCTTLSITPRSVGRYDRADYPFSLVLKEEMQLGAFLKVNVTCEWSGATRAEIVVGVILHMAEWFNMIPVTSGK